MLPDEVEVAAYYVAAEALTNVAKHARASVVHIGRDDGRRDPDAGRSGRRRRRGLSGRRLGLVGLQDRVEALGGTIKIDSSAEQGTCVVVTLPLATEAAQGRSSRDAQL